MTGGKERILIVDDEDMLVELNEQRLSRLGYEVVATTSSMEALAIFRKEPDAFDLVITDYTMPNLTGMDLAVELLKVRPLFRSFSAQAKVTLSHRKKQRRSVSGDFS